MTGIHWFQDEGSSTIPQIIAYLRCHFSHQKSLHLKFHRIQGWVGRHWCCFQGKKSSDFISQTFREVNRAQKIGFPTQITFSGILFPRVAEVSKCGAWNQKKRPKELAVTIQNEKSCKTTKEKTTKQFQSHWFQSHLKHHQIGSNPPHKQEWNTKKQQIFETNPTLVNHPPPSKKSGTDQPYQTTSSPKAASGSCKSSGLGEGGSKSTCGERGLRGWRIRPPFWRWFSWKIPETEMKISCKKDRRYEEMSMKHTYMYMSIYIHNIYTL